MPFSNVSIADFEQVNVGSVSLISERKGKVFKKAASHY